MVWRDEGGYLFVSIGQRKCVDKLSEGFSLAGNEGLLNNFTKILYETSISKNVMVWKLHRQSVELRDFREPMNIYKLRNFSLIKLITYH